MAAKSKFGCIIVLTVLFCLFLLQAHWHQRWSYNRAQFFLLFRYSLMHDFYFFMRRMESSKRHFDWHFNLILELKRDDFLVDYWSGLKVFLHQSFLVLGGLIGDPIQFDLILHFFLIEDNCEGIVRSVHIIIDAGITLASSIQVKMYHLFRNDIYIFDIHTETLQLLNILNLVICGKKFDQPTVDVFAGLISLRIRHLSLEIEVVPKLQVHVTFECLSELLENRLQTTHIFLKISVNVKLLQIQQFLLKMLPILESAGHVDVDNTAACSFSSVIKVFLAGIHDNGSGKHLLEKASCTEIALELFNYILYSLLFDLFDDSLHEGHPIHQITISFNFQFLLPTMLHEGVSQFFGVVVHVFGEPQHDYHPNLIRLYLQISVVQISSEEGAEEAI